MSQAKCSGSPANYKNLLQQWCQAMNRPLPIYTAERNKNSRLWTAKIDVQTCTMLGPPRARKIDSEQIAAMNLLRILEERVRGGPQKVEKKERPGSPMPQVHLSEKRRVVVESASEDSDKDSGKDSGDENELTSQTCLIEDDLAVLLSSMVDISDDQKRVNRTTVMPELFQNGRHYSSDTFGPSPPSHTTNDNSPRARRTERARRMERAGRSRYNERDRNHPPIRILKRGEPVPPSMLRSSSQGSSTPRESTQGSTRESSSQSSLIRTMPLPDGRVREVRESRESREVPQDSSSNDNLNLLETKMEEGEALTPQDIAAYIIQQTINPTPQTISFPNNIMDRGFLNHFQMLVRGKSLEVTNDATYVTSDTPILVVLAQTVDGKIHSRLNGHRVRIFIPSIPERETVLAMMVVHLSMELGAQVCGVARSMGMSRVNRVILN